MKKRTLFLLTTLATLIFAIAAFAYNQSTSQVVTESSSCCKNSDSCPMKSKMKHDGHAEHKDGDHAKKEGHNCCGDSCPMKAKDGQSGEAKGCCGDSCPMKKKDGAATTVSATAASDSKGCCDDCACCKGKADTSV